MSYFRKYWHDFKTLINPKWKVIVKMILSLVLVNAGCYFLFYENKGALFYHDALILYVFAIISLFWCFGLMNASISNAKRQLERERIASFTKKVLTDPRQFTVLELCKKVGRDYAVLLIQGLYEAEKRESFSADKKHEKEN